MESTKIQTAFRFDAHLMNRLKEAAKRERRSLNNFVENLLYNVMEDQPNDETVAAMEEALKGVDLKTCDTSSIDNFLKSLELK